MNRDLSKKARHFARVWMVFFMVAVFVVICNPTSNATSNSTTTRTSENGNNTSTENSKDIGNAGENNGLHTDVDGLSITYNNENGNLSATVRILIFLTVISIAPSLLVMLTSFTRIIVVLHFTRQAIGTQTAPPNQVLVGLALFLTLFIMYPTFTTIYDEAIKPYDAGQITQEEAIKKGQKPLREFMFKETQTKDIDLFLDISGESENFKSYDDVSMTVLIPSFILSELRTAFIIGFLVYIPFIVIDMVVASVLMSMGMMMLPPSMISAPFKILLFVLVDGWDLIIGNLVKTFY
ncbi:flagellar biosynthetic protein FliP [Acetitomaculum ruminis DSM 5522]|uniref:Flagellar biosynthetic protein FliP n=1 Tax=Acetitomaculum ruminis DSM 5522 TaxID=1120918 RepID=A0A1I0ZLE8_9FIRM|nr:flagellar type III secretion system pore protein FliP [Acetitomaculum ruminis]SFB25208.1 flagellar biosynthetic protein FliP [Acetitomaculum ruminis DSM 5522]